MDYNWFFSSLSQSTAAIVGLFGAFIFTKIINNEQQFNINLKKITDLITKSDYIKNKLSYCHFAGYNAACRISILETIWNLFITNSNSLELTENELIEKAENNFSAFDNHNEAIQEIIELKNEYKNRELNPYHFPHSERIRKLEMSKNLNNGGLINDLVLETKYHTEQIKNLLELIESNPESSSLVTISIIISIFLTILCIVCPLLIMPTNEDFNPFTFQISFQGLRLSLCSLKGLFVLLLAILICLMFIVFGIKNYNMKYSKKDKVNLKKYSKLENYSEYLKNYVDNSECKGEVPPSTKKQTFMSS